MTKTPAASVARSLSPADILTTQRLGDLAVTDDSFLFVLHGPAAVDQEATSDIWIAPRNDPPRRLTGGKSLDTLPTPAPDGCRLAFASNRDGAGLFALYLVDISSGTDEPVTGPLGDFAGSVEQISWSIDGRHLLVLTADVGAETGSAFGGRSVEPTRSDFAVAVHRPRPGWRRLNLVDVDTGRSREVGPRHTTVWEFGWTGAGKPAAVVSADPGESGWFDATVAILDIDERTAHTVYEPNWQVQNVEYSHDGGLLAFIEAPQSDRGLIAGQVVVIDLAAMSVHLPIVGADVTRLQWTSDRRLFWTGLISVETACGFLTCDLVQPDPVSSVDLRWQGLATLGAMERYQAYCDVSGELIVAVVEALGRPPELCRLQKDEDDPWSQLTWFNRELSDREAPRQSVYSWRSRGGELVVDGLLLLPKDHVADRPLPLVIWVHGGPSNAHTSVFAPAVYAGEALVLTQRGCAVLLPNPRGSTGRGVEYTAANLGDLGGGDLDDLLGAIDALALDGVIDPRRVGIAGASYGGFMAAWAAVRTNEFAAAVPISSITNWLSHRHTSGLARFDDIYLQADAQDSAGAYLTRSPIMYARDATTPTLLIHGESDRACPVGQGQELFRALAEAGCVVELVVYPDEGHEIRRPQYVLDACMRVIDWFSTHLLMP